MLLNKYECYIAYESHTNNILNGHIDPTFLHTCHKTQPTAINTTHVIVKYVPETNMPNKLGIYDIYAKYMIDLYGRCICIYVPHMK